MDFIESTIKTYSGLSSETKPTIAAGTDVPNGSRWREVDTAKIYHFNESDDIWYLEGATIDSATHALNTIDYPHHEIHSGSHYFIKEVETLSMNSVLDIQVTPANTLKWPHWELIFDTSSEYEFWLYEDVAINTVGTSQTPINRDRNSLNTAGMAAATIVNSSIANANSDTAIAGALQLAHGKIGSGKQNGGQGSSRQELILQQNIPYSIRFLAVAAGYLNWLFDWYEHTNKQ